MWLHANRVARISDEETKLPMFSTSWKSFEAEGLILVLHYSKYAAGSPVFDARTSTVRCMHAQALTCT